MKRICMFAMVCVLAALGATSARAEETKPVVLHLPNKDVILLKKAEREERRRILIQKRADKAEAARQLRAAKAEKKRIRAQRIRR